jgi:hypothetical protein
MNLLILESLVELLPKGVARVKGPKGLRSSFPLTRIATPKALLSSFFD